VSSHFSSSELEKLSGQHLIPKLGRWYFATAASRIDPSFFIIGVQKGGTTALAQYLIDHPQVIAPQRKDIYFFNNIEHFRKGKRWYNAHFAHALYRKIYEWRTGEKHTVTFDPTPNYFAAPHAAERLHALYPDAKLILLLRNPTERAWSNYRMCCWHGFESLSFEDALACEDERLRTDRERAERTGTHSYVEQRLAYRTHGIYVNYLREWLKYFRREQLLILQSENLSGNPAAIYGQVTDFAGLKKHTGIDFSPVNKGKIEKEMQPGTRTMLNDYYRPYNEELFALLNTTFNWT
jgi:hypothetical protein